MHQIAKDRRRFLSGLAGPDESSAMGHPMRPNPYRRARCRCAKKRNLRGIHELSWRRDGIHTRTRRQKDSSARTLSLGEGCRCSSPVDRARAAWDIGCRALAVHLLLGEHLGLLVRGRGDFSLDLLPRSPCFPRGRNPRIPRAFDRREAAFSVRVANCLPLSRILSLIHI